MSTGEPRFETQPEILLAGCPQFGDPGTICPGTAWERLFALRKSIGLPKGANVGYGLEVYPPNFRTEDKQFYYFAGFEATEQTEKHPGFFLNRIPECVIAVFDVPDNDFSKFPQVFGSAYKEWLPGSGYQLSHGFDFERYTNAHEAVQKTEVCLPVVKKPG